MSFDPRPSFTALAGECDHSNAARYLQAGTAGLGRAR